MSSPLPFTKPISDYSNDEIRTAPEFAPLLMVAETIAVGEDVIKECRALAEKAREKQQREAATPAMRAALLAYGFTNPTGKYFKIEYAKLDAEGNNHLDNLTFTVKEVGAGSAGGSAGRFTTQMYREFIGWAIEMDYTQRPSRKNGRQGIGTLRILAADNEDGFLLRYEENVLDHHPETNNVIPGEFLDAPTIVYPPANPNKPVESGDTIEVKTLGEFLSSSVLKTVYNSKSPGAIFRLAEWDQERVRIGDEMPCNDDKLTGDWGSCTLRIIDLPESLRSETEATEATEEEPVVEETKPETPKRTRKGTRKGKGKRDLAD